MIIDLIILALLVLLTRLPFMSRLYYHWDSAQFGLALQNYNVSIHQPHPPGYILYVALARLINLAVPDGNLAYVIVSIIFSIGTVIFLYLLAREMFSRSAGWLAAILLIFSPLFWGYGEVAFAYPTEAFFSVLIAYLAWRIWAFPVGAGQSPWSINLTQGLLSLFLGLAGGFRQGLVIFLLPLWLVTLIKTGWKKIVISLIILFLVSLAWFIPQTFLSGGQKAYLGESLNQWTQIIWAFSLFNYGWEGLSVNLLIFISYTLFALGFALVPLVGLAWFTGRNRKTVSKQKIWFILWWIGPAIIFYLLIHMRQPGYVLTYLPALYLLIGYFLAWLGDLIGSGNVHNQSWRRPVLIVLTLLMIAGNFWLFVGWPAIPSSYGFIHRQEQQLMAKFDYLEKNFPPYKTLVFGGDYFRHVMYYLPDYPVLWFGPLHRRPEEMNFYHKILMGQRKKLTFLWPAPGQTKVVQEKVVLPVPAGITQVVVFDEKILPLSFGINWQKINLGQGSLYFVTVKKTGRFIMSYHHLEYQE